MFPAAPPEFENRPVHGDWHRIHARHPSMMNPQGSVPELLEGLRTLPPTGGNRFRIKAEARSSPAFIDRFDRLQVLGEIRLDPREALRRRPGRAFERQPGHTGCINALAWSQDGRFLASGSDDTKVCIWGLGAALPSGNPFLDASADCPDCAPKLDFGLSEVIHTGHTLNIFSVKWAPNSSSRRLLTCAGDSQTRIFDLTRVTMAPPIVSVLGTTWTEWGANDGALLKVYKCHTDRVKRIATEENPDVFLTCSEDGTVRQQDLRVPHTCSRDRSTCGPPLVTYQEEGISLYSLSLSKLAPWQFVVAGTSPWAFLHDRRMNPRGVCAQWGTRSQPHLYTQCVRKFGLPSPHSEPRDEETSSRLGSSYPPRRRRFRQRSNVTATKLSEYNGRDLLVSYSTEDIYLFDIYGEKVEDSHPSSRPHSEGHDRDDTAPIKRNHSTLSVADEEGSESRASKTSKPDSVAEGEPSGPANPEREALSSASVSSSGALLEGHDSAGQNRHEGDTEPLEITQHGEEDDIEMLLEDVEEQEAMAAATVVPEEGAPIVHPVRSYRGHLNEQTVKDVNFGGAIDNFVLSGSDDGNFFVWDKRRGELLGIFEGDESVVNVLTMHPSLPILAASGIDETVKIFGPFAESRARGEESFSRTLRKDEIVATNQRQRGMPAMDGPGLTREMLLELLHNRLEPDGEEGGGPRVFFAGPNGEEECMIM